MTDVLNAQRREVGNLVMEGIPQEIPTDLTERLLQYQNTRGAAFRDWSPDGKGMIIGTRFGEVSQAHYVSEAGGSRKQLTFFEEPVKGASVCPDKNREGFIFRKDIGGNEQNQLYFFDLTSGKSTLLTDGESKYSGGYWNRDGSLYYFTSNKRNGKDFDIYINSLDGKAEDAKMIFESNGWWYAYDWSFDGKHLLIGEYISANKSNVYVLNIETGDYYQIGNTEDDISYSSTFFSKDDNGIYLVSDENEEFKKLRYYDLETKKETVLTGSIDWDVAEVVVDHSGEQLAFTVNEGGILRLYLMNTNSHKYSVIQGIPEGQVYGLNFHPDNQKLAMTINSSFFPSDAFIYDIRSATAERWTFSEVGGLNTESFVEPSLIEYPTFDKEGDTDRMIPAFKYLPEGPGPFPVLISIHGGPESQFAPYFNPTFQYIINELGIAIIAPNVRGSRGYGKTFLTLDNGFKREDSVKDIGALLDWIDQQPEFDNSRIAVTGGSYGGYMSYASMIHYSDRLTCGISSVGISNFVTFLENTKAYRRDLRRVEYGDERDPAMRTHLEAISPTNHADKLIKPIFIVQGANDPRVPLSEAEQMLEKVKMNGQEVWYLMAKDEGHGFRKKNNKDFYYSSYMLFLENFLKNK